MMGANHPTECNCWRCLGQAYGAWIDELASQTSPGAWQIVGTITFSTPHFPWRRGFPSSSSFRPTTEFAHHIFDKLVFHLESELGERVDFVVADQLGAANGRLHQHFLMASSSLADYPRPAISEWLGERAGYNKILPFQHGAAYYISRYIRRDIDSCEWNLRIGNPPVDESIRNAGGRVDVARSVDLPSEFFHISFNRRCH